MCMGSLESSEGRCVYGQIGEYKGRCPQSPYREILAECWWATGGSILANVNPLEADNCRFLIGRCYPSEGGRQLGVYGQMVHNEETE